MSVLNFIPLLVWMLGFPLIRAWEEHLGMMDGRGEDNPENKKAYGALWLFGMMAWFFIGIGLTIECTQ